MTSMRGSLGMMLLLGDYAPRDLYAVPAFSCSAESSVPFGADGHESHVTLIPEIRDHDNSSHVSRLMFLTVCIEWYVYCMIEILPVKFSCVPV